MIKKIAIVLFVAIVCALSCNDRGADELDPIIPEDTARIDTTINPVDQP